MPTIAGITVFTRRITPGRSRPGRWQPKSEARYFFTAGSALLLVQLQPFKGVYPLSLWRNVDGVLTEGSEFPSLWSSDMKKVSLGVDASAPLPALSSDSTVLKRFPRLREFLTLTAYDDGSPRAPGRLWLDSDGTAFVVTLFEPSAMVRARFRAASLDDVIQLSEVFLGLENPPWEIDQWARERVTSKKKK